MVSELISIFCCLKRQRTLQACFKYLVDLARASESFFITYLPLRISGLLGAEKGLVYLACNSTAPPEAILII